MVDAGNLSPSVLWKNFSDNYLFLPELGLALDTSRMRVNPAAVLELETRLPAICQQMADLEAGALANPDEQRRVGHYWLRNPEGAPETEIAVAIKKVVAEIKDFAAAVHSGKLRAEAGAFKNLLIVGIGGSALGPQLLSDALGSSADKIKIFFCDNTDPDGIARILSVLGDELKQTLVAVVSKSGGTVETRNGALEFAAAYQKAGLRFSDFALAITCEGSKLDKQAQAEGWLKRFYMWDWVGGRTSVFAAVGLLPAALQGIDIDGFLSGAAMMDKFSAPSVKGEWRQNPALSLAVHWFVAGEGKGKKDMVVLPYKDRLVLFSKYLQQLVMESLGKEKDLSGKTVNQGLAVYGNKGSTDQHAYVQQLRDGLNNFFATFILVLKDHCQGSPSDIEVEAGITSGDYLTGFLIGTRQALYENQRDSLMLVCDCLDAKTLGALIALYERSVGYYALLVNINAYHQPGVEAGKKAAARVIEIQSTLNRLIPELPAAGLTAEEIAKHLNLGAEVETIFLVLEHLSANSRLKRIGTERGPERGRYSRL